MGKNIVSHDFYCISCGNRGIPLARKRGHQHSRFHRKRLYCVHCKKEVNMVECRDEFEVKEFLKNFKNGVYEDEAKESIHYCGEGDIVNVK